MGRLVSSVLALIAHRQGQAEVAYTQLDRALGWLAQHHLDYLPYWWYPPLLSEICAQALVANLYTDVVERIFLNHLGGAGKAALTALGHGAMPWPPSTAYRLLQDLGDPILVAHLADGATKVVVSEPLAQWQTLPIAYPRLELMTALRRPKPNPTLMAVFGLYLNGVARRRLPTVRAAEMEIYITAI